MGYTVTGEAVLVVVEGAYGKHSANAKPSVNGHWYVVRTTVEGFEELKADLTEELENRKKLVTGYLS